MKRLGMVLVLSMMVQGGSWSLFAPTARYSFELTPHKRGKVLMDFKQQKIVVDIQGRRTLLPETSDEFMDYRENFGLEDVTFADLNFDGYTDIGVLVGIGYGGVNVCRDYFFYAPRTKRYVRQIDIACNLDIYSRKNRLLATMAKDGPSQESDIYWIDPMGAAHHIIKSTGHWPQNEEGDMIFRYTSDAHVKVPKTYFYAKPGGKRSKVYIIKGDRVSLLGLTVVQGETWVKVAYKSTKKTYRQWVRFSDLSFRDLPKEAL